MKSLEEKIFELKQIIMQVISEEELSPSIVELVIKDIYNEVKVLADMNLQNKIAQRQEQEQKDSQNETVEEVEDGGHKQIPD